MKNIFLFLSLFCYFNNSFSQEYSPMLEIGKTWNFKVINDVGFVYYFDLEATETVEINGLTYYHIEATHNNCESFLREDVSEKKIYGIWEGEEYLHYDFSLEIGDQMWIGGDFLTITDIGYDDFYGLENLKYFVLDNNYKLIESIGFESIGIADTIEYGCLQDQVFELLYLIGINDVLANNNSLLEQILIYPNPVKEVLNIESTYPINEIKIYNVLGVLVMEQQNPKYQINISNLPSGLFVVKLNTGQGTITKKIIKE